ncbi:MAG: SGNH/GDSL hydrolase family protein [Chitinophagaceae bacterium]
MFLRKFRILLLFMFLQQMAKGNSMTDSVLVVNAGINGNNTTDLVGRVDKAVLQQSPQLVIMMIGTNDMLNTRNILSLKAYEDNYETLLNILTKQASVLVMTIPPVNSSYIIMRKPELKFSENGPTNRVDSANHIIKRLAAKFNCQLIDLNNILMACGGSDTNKQSLFQNEANSGTPDGVHPTADGYRVMATAVYQNIVRSYPAVKKIVCFGDSITYGYNVDGGGTTDGQSYPALLKKMLNR